MVSCCAWKGVFARSEPDKFYELATQKGKARALRRFYHDSINIRIDYKTAWKALLPGRSFLYIISDFLLKIWIECVIIIVPNKPNNYKVEVCIFVKNTSSTFLLLSIRNQNRFCLATNGDVSSGKSENWIGYNQSCSPINMRTA